MTVAVSKAAEDGAHAVVCASTGNTSASAAAYAARAGLRCIVVVPAGNIALGKLAQAQVARRPRRPDRGLASTTRCGSCASSPSAHPITLVNNLNPYRLEGQKTAAWEVVEELGGAPDWLALPVGNGGNITAYWRGFREAVERGEATGCRACSAARRRARRRWCAGVDVARPETVATAIRIGAPVRRAEAAAAARESGGGFVAVPDDEILDWFRRLGARRGHLLRAVERRRASPGWPRPAAGRPRRGRRVVCVLPATASRIPTRRSARRGRTRSTRSSGALEALLA